jgi:hypothetical protein
MSKLLTGESSTVSNLSYLIHMDSLSKERSIYSPEKKAMEEESLMSIMSSFNLNLDLKIIEKEDEPGLNEVFSNDFFTMHSELESIVPDSRITPSLLKLNENGSKLAYSVNTLRSLEPLTDSLGNNCFLHNIDPETLHVLLCYLNPSSTTRIINRCVRNNMSSSELRSNILFKKGNYIIKIAEKKYKFEKAILLTQQGHETLTKMGTERLSFKGITLRCIEGSYFACKEIKKPPARDILGVLNLNIFIFDDRYSQENLNTILRRELDEVMGINDNLFAELGIF